MLKIVFITIAILSGVQGKTYSICNGACTISFDTNCATLWTADGNKFGCSNVNAPPTVSFTPNTCATLFTVDGISWSCSKFRMPTTWPSNIDSCPGHIVINQTDNSVVCLNRRCPGKMVAYTSGWECEDPTCAWPLKKVLQGYVDYQKSDFDYVCPIPDCKGSPVKNTDVSWACDTTVYEQGQVDYRNAHIWLVIGVILLIMTTMAALCYYLGKKSAEHISFSNRLVDSSMSM